MIYSLITLSITSFVCISILVGIYNEESATFKALVEYFTHDRILRYDSKYSTKSDILENYDKNELKKKYYYYRRYMVICAFLLLGLEVIDFLYSIITLMK